MWALSCWERKLLYHVNTSQIITTPSINDDPYSSFDAARPTNATTSTPTSSPSGPMTRAQAKLLQAKVNSLLSSCDFDTPLDGLLLHTHTLCIIRYKEKDPWNGGTTVKGTNRTQTPAVLPDQATGTTGARGTTGP